LVNEGTSSPHRPLFTYRTLFSSGSLPPFTVLPRDDFFKPPSSSFYRPPFLPPLRVFIGPLPQILTLFLHVVRFLQLFFHPRGPVFLRFLCCSSLLPTSFKVGYLPLVLGVFFSNNHCFPLGSNLFFFSLAAPPQSLVSSVDPLFYIISFFFLTFFPYPPPPSRDLFFYLGCPAPRLVAYRTLAGFAVSVIHILFLPYFFPPFFFCTFLFNCRDGRLVAQGCVTPCAVPPLFCSMGHSLSFFPLTVLNVFCFFPKGHTLPFICPQRLRSLESFF